MNHASKSVLVIACFALAGCATLRSFDPRSPAVPPAAPPSTRPDAASAADDTAVSEPSVVARVQRLLHVAFAAVDDGDRERAVDSLAAATDHLVASYSPGDDTVEPLPRAVADDLSRAALDLYHEALPGIGPIPPDAPVARLIRSLPDPLKSTLSPNVRYRHLYMRTLAGTSPIRIDIHPRVLEKIAFFQRNGQRVFRTWMRRSGTYAPLIRRTLREDGLPEDLIYLSMIESGFNTRAYSRARAVGMWQFVGATARLYGLRRDTWIDERRDPVKATHAAARHLNHLYNLFGDWQLVITAYNCGQGRLQRAIRTDGTHDFWELDSLPGESRNHLPKFMAVLLMARDPEFFGVQNLEFDEPLAYDIVKVTDPVDLRLAAQCAGTTYANMRRLNPELRLGYSPPMPSRKTYALRVPVERSDRFLDRYARIPARQKVQLVDYAVRPGDTISNIAVSLGVRASTIMDANGIRNPRRLRAGQKLKIPVHPKNSQHARALVAARSGKTVGSGDPVVYRVKRGDTLWDIARSQGVTANQIRAWNALRATGHIHPGDKLTIWRPRGGPLPEGTRPIANVDIYHRVRRGDTLWDIARAYGTSIGALKRINDIGDASQIRVGDRIRIRAASGEVE